jgi:hypothetical protein
MIQCNRLHQILQEGSQFQNSRLIPQLPLLRFLHGFSALLDQQLLQIRQRLGLGSSLHGLFRDVLDFLISGRGFLRHNQYGVWRFPSFGPENAKPAGAWKEKTTSSKPPFGKGPSGRGFKIPFKRFRARPVCKSDGGLDSPGLEIGGVRDSAGIMPGQTAL